MPLSMTKVAFGASSFEDLQSWFKTRRDQARLTTRYLPKRHAEMIGGSVYWILKHQLVARSAILGFENAADGRTEIVISTCLTDVHPKPCRAHQGWRYLEEGNAPSDLAEGESADMLPPALAGELAKLGLA